METDGAGRISTPLRDHASLNEAITYANELQAAYERKYSDEFERQRLLSGMVIGLAGYILGAAYGGAHADAIAYPALIGGTVYQLGTWNTTRNRNDIYKEGARAIACSQAAIAPLTLPAWDVERIRKEKEQLNLGLRNAAAARGEVQRWKLVAADRRGQTAALPSEQAADAKLPKADEAIEQGLRVAQQASNLETGIGEVGATFGAKMNVIRSAVNDAINGSLADLRQLPAHVSALASAAAIFAPGAKFDVSAKVGEINTRMAGQQGPSAQGGSSGTKTVPPAQEDASLRLAQAIGALDAALGALRASTETLNGTLQLKQGTTIRANLEGCGVDLEKIKGLSIAASYAIVAGQAKTHKIPIQGGTRDYNATLLTKPAPGLNIEVPFKASYLEIVATTATVAGETYRVLVNDQTGATVEMTLKVEAAASPESGNARGQPLAPTNTCTPGRQWSREEICLVQHHTRAAVVDGKFGPASCAAFKAGGYPNGLLNDQAMTEIKGLYGLAPSAPVADVRAKLTEKGVKYAKKDCESPGAPTAAAPAATVSAASPTVAVAGAPAPQLPQLAGDAACFAPETGKLCAATGVRCAYECTLGAEDVKVLRGKFGLPEAPVAFDEALRLKLSAYQVLNGLENKRGDYTLETAKAINRNPPAR